MTGQSLCLSLSHADSLRGAWGCTGGVGGEAGGKINCQVSESIPLLPYAAVPLAALHQSRVSAMHTV